MANININQPHIRVTKGDPLSKLSKKDAARVKRAAELDLLIKESQKELDGIKDELKTEFDEGTELVYPEVAVCKIFGKDSTKTSITNLSGIEKISKQVSVDADFEELVETKITHTATKRLVDLAEHKSSLAKCIDVTTTHQTAISLKSLMTE